ncbi:Holliday junction branch migration protein RuvA [Candidatus Parcubacteria bacterium]|nr:Holliday junction branch migration protein RuvA [Candidatus Parcubacteria bacterium]
MWRLATTVRNRRSNSSGGFSFLEKRAISRHDEAMIGFVEGTVAGRQDSALLVDVGGVGLRLLMGPESLAKVPPNGTKIKLWTHLAVSQFSWTLYGFLTVESYELFQLFLEVPGFGPRRVLGMVDGADPAKARAAIEAEDGEELARLCGISVSTAEKLVVGLRKVRKPAGKKPRKTASAAADSDQRMVEEALVSLGYGKTEAREAATASSGVSVEAWVRAALGRTKK